MALREALGPGGECNWLVSREASFLETRLGQARTLVQLYFNLCLQVDMISERLLRVEAGSAAAITIFSVKHRSHLLDPHL